ncbi:MAG: type II toxin-antitoxin system CcdA family antitoxin [Steroidobacteraceae bacterium]
MPAPYDLSAPRKPANLTINADLLRYARAQKINLSATLERALVDELRRRQREDWLEHNRDAIAAYNAEVEKQGVFSDGSRAF